MNSIAVLIDVENMDVEQAPTIMRHARALGDTPVVRLFGDFSVNRHAGWCRFALESGHETVMQGNGGSGKNSTDIVLTIHAMDLLFSSAVDGFCLVSNDRDFVPLALRLRSARRPVYVICSAPDTRIEGACTEAFALGPAIRVLPPPRPSPSPLVAAFLAVSGDRKEMTLVEAGKLLRRHSPKMFEGLPKSGGLRKLFSANPDFVELGKGPSLRIRLKEAR